MDQPDSAYVIDGGGSCILPENLTEIFRRPMYVSSEIIQRNILCLEARPHPEYVGEKWWHDVDIVIDEAKKRDMTIWILDDAHFPTGMANDGIKKQPEKCRRFLFTQFVDVVGPMPAAQVDVDLLTTRQPQLTQ